MKKFFQFQNTLFAKIEESPPLVREYPLVRERQTGVVTIRRGQKRDKTEMFFPKIAINGYNQPIYIYIIYHFWISDFHICKKWRKR